MWANRIDTQNQIRIYKFEWIIGIKFFLRFKKRENIIKIGKLKDCIYLDYIEDMIRTELVETSRGNLTNRSSLL